MKNYEEISKEEIYNIINHDNTCLLSLIDKNKPLTIPMSYQISNEDNKLYFNFKNLNSDRKTNIIKNNNNVQILLYSKSWGSTDTIIIKGTASVNEEDIKVEPEEIIGKRYYPY